MGHEPDLGQLAARLIGAKAPVEFKKGAICRIDLDGLPLSGPGHLRWFVTPAHAAAPRRLTRSVRVSVIINPIAGLFRRPDQGARRAAKARAVLAAAGVEADVRLTEGPGHARVARGRCRARGARISCTRGAATARSTRSAACSRSAMSPWRSCRRDPATGSPAPSAFRASRAAALRHALRVPERRIDVGEIAGHIFLNVAGVGFDAHIAAEFSRDHGRRGFRRYARIVTRELFSYSPRPATWRLKRS